MALSEQLLRAAVLLSGLLSASASGGKNESRGETLVIFAFFAIALGGLVTFILNRLKINLPYTVVLLLLGFAIGECLTQGGDTWAEYGKGVKSWQHIDPELIFYSFLPVLIFGDAMSLNWHHVKASLAQSLLLAGPGVLMGAFATGLFMYFAMPLGWSWFLCMVFGAVVSATDPVAVVSLLNDAGASSSLTILIIGESLLKDGTAIVMFKLYFSMMEGDSYTPGEIILYFLKMVIGSPAVGVLFGLVGVFCLSMASKPSSHDDVTIQTAISICCAYFVFFFAEYECGLSGVLATATAGVMFAWLSPTTILNQDHMQHIWHFAEWLCNTLIFLLAGLLVGTIKSVNNKDWGYLVAMYVFLSVLRCGIVGTLYPILCRSGLPLSVNDAVFMSFAGLRGALAIALGLIILGEHEALGLSQRDADRVFFFIAGIASLTLLINATCANLVLDALGLLRDTNAAGKYMTVNQVVNRLRTQVLSEVEETVLCKHFDTGIHWSDLIQYNTLLQKHEEDIVPTKEEAELAVQEMLDKEIISDARDAPTKAQARWKAAINSEVKSFQRKKVQQLKAIRERYIAERQILAYCRSMYLSLLRVQYWEQISAGKMLRNNAFSTQILLYSVDVGLDHVWEPSLRDWPYIKSQSLFTSQYSTSAVYTYILDKFGSYLPRQMRLALRRWSGHQLFTKVRLLLNFIEAHESAQSKYDAFLRPNGCCGFTSDEQVQVVVEESRLAVNEAREILHHINHADVVTVATVEAGQSLLHRQAELIAGMVKEGFLDSKSSEHFFDIIEHDSARLCELKHKRETIQLMRRRSSEALLRLSQREKEKPPLMIGQNRDAPAAEASSAEPPSDHIVHVARRFSDSRIELRKFEEALKYSPSSSGAIDDAPLGTDSGSQLAALKSVGSGHDLHEDLHKL